MGVLTGCCSCGRLWNGDSGMSGCGLWDGGGCGCGGWGG